jgi:hypothetical protein
MIEELITKVFEARDAAHRAHWKTNSYAQHEALGDFYGDVTDTLDKYVETCQGACGVKTSDQKESAKILHENVVWINQNRETLAKNIPALENILDELTGVYLKALYKLENLR